MCSTYMPEIRAPAFHYHLDDRLVVFKNEKLSSAVRNGQARRHIINRRKHVMSLASQKKTLMKRKLKLRVFRLGFRLKDIYDQGPK